MTSKDMALPTARATHEPSPDGLSHSVGVANADAPGIIKPDIDIANEIIDSFRNMLSAAYIAPATDRHWLTKKIARHRIDTEQGSRMCALMDSQYRAGVTAGWNAQFAADPNARLADLKRVEPGFLAALRGEQ